MNAFSNVRLIATRFAWVRPFSNNSRKVPPATLEAPAWQYGYGSMDPSSGGLKSFTPLPHFTGNSWQGGKELPDKSIGWVMLNAEGGHPGNPSYAAVRRWTAPRDGTIRISGKLGHATDVGDGVRGWIVSSKAGKLGEWVAKNTKVDTATEKFDVKRGEQIDFIVDCRNDENSDSFTWAPRLRYVGELPKEMAGARQDWEAKTDFGGPGDSAPQTLTPWRSMRRCCCSRTKFPLSIDDLVSSVGLPVSCTLRNVPLL